MIKIQKRFPSYSGTPSPLVLRSLESSLQFRKLHCPSKSIFDKDDLVLHKKLKHRGDVLFDRAHSWLQGLPSGQPCLDPSPWQHRPCTSPNSAPQKSLSKTWEPSRRRAPSCSAHTSQEHTSLLVLNSSWHLQRKPGLLRIAITWKYKKAA